MESWNYLVQTAMLGTSRRMPEASSLAPGLRILSEQLLSGIDRESAFLDVASLHLNYRQCGYMPIHDPQVKMLEAGSEDLPYAGPEAHRLLLAILETGSESHLANWLSQCSLAKQLVQPDLIPVLLNVAVQNENLSGLIRNCGGRRMNWLADLKSDWSVKEPKTDAELWETGSLEERKAFLASLRLKDPPGALQLLQSVWDQENAATRAALLQSLLPLASDVDLPFLEPLRTDKSSKVRDVATEILKTIPGSSVVKLYGSQLRPLLELRRDNKILGFGGKVVFHLHGLKDPDPVLFLTGIEKVSSEKNIPDDQFIANQLLPLVPPSWIGSWLDASPQEILRAIKGRSDNGFLSRALATAAMRFNEKDWLREILLSEESPLIPDALSLLPPEDADSYAQRHILPDNEAFVMVPRIAALGQVWSPELALSILKHVAKYPSHYSKKFLQEVVQLLPDCVQAELHKLAPENENLRLQWLQTSEYINHLLSLKQQTLTAFHA